MYGGGSGGGGVVVGGGSVYVCTMLEKFPMRLWYCMRYKINVCLLHGI